MWIFLVYGAFCVKNRMLTFKYKIATKPKRKRAASESLCRSGGGAGLLMGSFIKAFLRLGYHRAAVFPVRSQKTAATTTTAKKLKKKASRVLC